MRTDEGGGGGVVKGLNFAVEVDDEDGEVFEIGGDV